MARIINHFEIDHVETVRQEYAQKTGTLTNIVQLTPGGLAASGTWVEMPGIRLEWNYLDSRIRAREMQHEWGILLAFALPGSGAMNYRGFRVEDNLAVLYRNGTYMDYVCGPGVKTLIICVHADIIKERSWKLGTGSFRRVNRSSLLELESICRRVTVREEWSGSIERAESAAILNSLERALQPWMDASSPLLPPKKGAFHFEVVEDVEKIWKESGARRPPPVRELVDKIGIPERTLFHAFNQSVGMGPSRYLKLLQLHVLRDRLLEADPESNSVAEIAHAWGFEQLGHLAAYYRRHFLELPSQTLKRVQ